MKTRMIIAALAVAATSSTAAAGYVMTQPVVAASGSYAYGSMLDARQSADANQYIGCDVGTPSTGSAYVSCYAYSAAGVFSYCYSYDPAMVDAGRSINDESYIYFTTGAGSICSNITVRNSSYDL